MPARSSRATASTSPQAVVPRARRSGQRNPEARRRGFRRRDVPTRRPAGRCVPGRRGEVRAAGYECVFLGDRRRGRGPRGRRRARPPRPASIKASGRRAVILSGGELTVTLRGDGRGGPNQEYALALALALEGTAGIAALAATPTVPTAAAAVRTIPPAPMWIPRPAHAREASASILPPFSPTTIRAAFFTRLGDLVASGPNLHERQ